MNASLPAVYLARHGETAWSITGQHTGLTDLPLTPRGEENARRLSDRLKGMTFAYVFTSPLQRAHRTCMLAGFGPNAVVDADLVEWDYGDYEGKKTTEILAMQPGWQLFRAGCPNGESVAKIAARADRVIARLRGQEGDGLVFSSGHFLRVLAARWCGLDAAWGRCLTLGTGSLSMLSYEHSKVEPVIQLWNELPANS